MHRRILALALPAIVTNITTPLLGLLDVAITGHMGSAVYLAAIAVGGTMFNMIYWLFGFLRMGSSGMTAQACGRGDHLAERRIFLQGLAVAVAAGALIILLRGPIGELLMRFMDADADTVAMARLYFSICVWGAPAVLATYCATGWLLGMQNSKAGMWISLIINLSNIALSLLLVYGASMMIEGVAIGTLAAQWIGFIVAMAFCSRYLGKSKEPFNLSQLLDGDGIKGFFRVNSFIFLRTLCLIAVTMWFTRVGSMQGTVMLAVNALLMQLFILFSYFMDGFAYAGEALAGLAIGQGDRHGLSATVRALFKWGFGIALIFSVLYFVAGEKALQLLSDAPGIADASREYLPWAITVPFAGFAAFIWDGIYIGATATARMFISVAIGATVFFGLYLLLFPLLGNHGLWLAFISYLAARAITLTVLFPRATKIGAR